MPNSNSTPRAVVQFLVLLAAGVAMTLAAGLVHGRFSQRWGPAAELQTAAKHLEDFPTEFGAWQRIEDLPISAGARRMLSCEGYVHRRYLNRETGLIVAIAIIVGPPGPTAVHTPEICYSSRAYSIHEPRQRVTLSDGDGRTHSFWSLSFHSNSLPREHLRVYYGWRAEDAWTASDSPRFEFGGGRMLYKLQVASTAPESASDNPVDPSREFLSALLHSEWTFSIEGR